VSFLRRLTGRKGTTDGEDAATSTVPPTAASLQWFLDALQARPEPTVLDLGTGTERQLMNLISLGFKVTADDTIIERLRAVRVDRDEDLYAIARDPAPLFRFDLPSGEFDGVLAWSSFDRVSYLGGWLLAREIARILRVGWVLTGTWAPPPSRRDRAASTSTLITGTGVRPTRFLDSRPARYEISEILALFPGFNQVHSMVYVDGTRRILLEKAIAAPSLPFPKARP
jgi:SAM-dependent methyltransferase